MARTKAAKPTTQTKVGTKRTKESGHTSSTKVEVAKKKQKVHEEEELSEESVIIQEKENLPNKNSKKDKQKPKKAILTTQQLTQNEEAKDADAVLHKQLALFEFDREVKEKLLEMEKMKTVISIKFKNEYLHQLSQIPPQVRNMKLSELNSKFRGDIDAASKSFLSAK